MPKTALLVIDMQVGLFAGTPCHDADGMLRRINTLAQTLRNRGDVVTIIQHENESTLAPGSPMWQLLPGLDHRPGDVRIHKTASDCFYRSDLDQLLRNRGVKRVLVTGCATEFCVDTTVRAAASKDYEVIVAADGHTTKDRPYASAVTIIAHHNWVWANLVLPGRPIRVASTDEVLAEP